MDEYSILIVEDHALTRFGLRTTFESSQSNVKKIFEAENAKKAYTILKDEKIDIVIMDLGLPDIDGIEATREIKKNYPNIKIIILSSHEKEEDVIKSLKAGANAYATKDINPEKLIEISDYVYKGAAWFDPKIAQYVLNAAAANSEKTKTPSENDIFNLTGREIQVLSLITEGFSNQEIAKKLDVSIHTTKVHVCNILQKLEVQDRTQAAIKAIKNGIV